MRIDIKPLSVNECFQGRRFKTPKYKNYEKELLLKLKPLTVSNNKDLKVNIKLGLSNSNSDIDNPIKVFLDVLQKKYNFNDRQITELNIKKVKVKKGNEYIDFKINEL